MPDAADKVTEDDERAAQQFLDERARVRKIEESMRGYDPTLPQYCNDCGEQIDPARLDAYPRASRCTACASAYEQKAAAGGARA